MPLSIATAVQQCPFRSKLFRWATTGQSRKQAQTLVVAKTVISLLRRQGTGADSTRAERERKLKKPAGRAKGKPPVPVVPKSLSAVDSKTRTESAKPIETELPVHTTGSKRVAPTDGKSDNKQR